MGSAIEYSTLYRKCRIHKCRKGKDYFIRHPPRPPLLSAANKQTQLSAEGQALVVECEDWVWQEVEKRARGWMGRHYGREYLYQEARLGLVQAAIEFDPIIYPNIPFGAYARSLVRWRLSALARTAASRFPVWREFPQTKHGLKSEDDPVQIDVEDHRGDGREKALILWCSADYSAQRVCLDWRSRIILYLRFVEGLTLQEVGETLSITRERVRQLEVRARKMIDAHRDARTFRLIREKLVRSKGVA